MVSIKAHGSCGDWIDDSNFISRLHYLNLGAQVGIYAFDWLDAYYQLCWLKHDANEP